MGLLVAALLIGEQADAPHLLQGTLLVLGQRGQELIRGVGEFQGCAHDVAPLRVRRRASSGRSLGAGAGPHRPPDA